MITPEMQNKFLVGSFSSIRKSPIKDGFKIIAITFPSDIFDYQIYTLDGMEYVAIYKHVEEK